VWIPCFIGFCCCGALPILKPRFKFAVIAGQAFIAVVVKKQAKRQAVGFFMLNSTSAAFFVVWASRHAFILSSGQQQPSPSQAGSPPVSHPVINAAAQPTPALTEIAPAGQFRAHAPHSIQKFLSVTTAFFSISTNTPCGQTSQQRPQPVHLSTV